MAFNEGSEIVLQVDTDQISDPEWGEIYLQPLGIDEIGLKLMGDLPNLWDMDGEQLIGPRLYDDDAQYIVEKVDYDNSLIWLIQI